MMQVGVMDERERERERKCISGIAEIEEGMIIANLQAALSGRKYSQAENGQRWVK